MQKIKNLKKILREIRLELEKNTGRKRSKIIESKKNIKQLRKEEKNKLNQERLYYNGKA